MSQALDSAALKLNDREQLRDQQQQQHLEELTTLQQNLEQQVEEATQGLHRALAENRRLAQQLSMSHEQSLEKTLRQQLTQAVADGDTHRIALEQEQESLTAAEAVLATQTVSLGLLAEELEEVKER